MRPLLFIVGLAFVTTVFIANVDAIKCYFDVPGSDPPRGEVDCDDVAAKRGHPKGTFKECAILEVTDSEGVTRTMRNCLLSRECDNTAGGITYRCMKRCNSDLCNGDNNGAMTSTPPAPLLIAVITGVIAAVGI
ncbi:hypothetical protein AAVH_04665 [Aphelenchoides avenae]|nr:hypothetical protein AAVH_04665 [Aphelenchus avenae]